MTGPAQVYPNPAVDRVNIRFATKATQDAEVRLYTMAGVLATRVTGTVSTAQPMLTCDLNVAPGVYLYWAKCGGRVDKGKVVVVKRN